jgi:hypothetical protein
MDIYKGISREEYPLWRGWNYIALYSSITDDFDNDKPLQKLVTIHYLKKKMLITLFNLTPYILILGIYIANNT